MFRHALRPLMISAALLVSAHAASAESRLALVIGQSAYKSVPALPNPINDAKAVTQMLTDSGFEVSTASDLSQSQIRDQLSEFAGKVASKGGDIDRAGVLCRPWRADRRREFSGSGRHRSEARIRHSDPGGAAQRRAEHADLGAEQDAHPDARCLPQQSVRAKSARAPAAGLRSSTPRSARRTPSCRSRPRRARWPRTATAPTVPTPQRCLRRPKRPTFRSRKPSSARAWRSTRRPTAGRRRGTPRR